MAKGSPWKIRLGAEEWRKYTYEGAGGSAMTMIGSVSKGLLVGAIGRDDSGRYFQVVGDHMIELNSRQMEKAMRSASYGPRASVRHSRKMPSVSHDYVCSKGPQAVTAAPVVTIVKRRRIVLPA